MIKVRRKVYVARRSHGRKVLTEAPAPAVPRGRVPRVSRLMALAICFDRLVREGRVSGLSELARLARVSQPRMSQIMALNNLAPDIQEALLFLPPASRGRDTIAERTLRPLTSDPDWGRQRRELAALPAIIAQFAGMNRC